MLGPVRPGTGRGLELTLTGCFRGKDTGPEPKAQGLGGGDRVAERAATGSSGRACVPAADGTCCLPTVLSVRLSSAFTVCTVPLSRSSVHHGEAACLESEFGVSETVWRRCGGGALGRASAADARVPSWEREGLGRVAGSVLGPGGWAASADPVSRGPASPGGKGGVSPR